MVVGRDRLLGELGADGDGAPKWQGLFSRREGDRYFAAPPRIAAALREAWGHLQEEAGRPESGVLASPVNRFAEHVARRVQRALLAEVEECRARREMVEIVSQPRWRSSAILLAAVCIPRGRLAEGSLTQRAR